MVEGLDRREVSDVQSRAKLITMIYWAWLLRMILRRESPKAA